MVLNKIKSVVGRSAAANISGGKSMTVSNPNALAPSTGQLTFTEFCSKASKMLFEEKEWQCPCGHKFRASGEWVATVPAMCEVPSCPNPKFYLEGAGREMLASSPNGVALTEVDPSRQLSSSSSSGSGSHSGSPMGSRFGGRK